MTFNLGQADTFPKLLQLHVQRRGGLPAIREKKHGIWKTLSWNEFSDKVQSIATALAARGLQRGGHVALVGDNRPRLYAAMCATQWLGAVAVPLYEDAVAAEMSLLIQNAGITHVFAENQEVVDKILEILPECPTITTIVYDEDRGMRHYKQRQLISFAALRDEGLDLLAARQAWLHGELDKGRGSDPAAMFFTSGTTGQAKGVVLTHAALIDRARAAAEMEQLTDRDVAVAYLPPAWIGQNIFSYAQWLACGYVVNCPESAATVTIDLKEVGPTYYFAPPRVFEALLTSVMIRMEDAGAIKRKMFHACMAVAKRVGPALMDGNTSSTQVSLLDRAQYALGNLLVYGPLRNNLGMSRVRVAYTAGEAIGPDLFTFYRSIGINLKQLYGSTETAVFVCLQPDHQARADTVGVPISGVEIKVAENGEILVKSPGLLKEYYKNPQATAEVLTAEGWYHTSDAGFIDAHGHLKIIDRVKDVGRIKGGANDGAMFAPKYVENKLKFFPHIKEVVAYGDQREKVCVMVNIDFDAVGNWAERRNLPYAGYTDLAQKPETYQLIKNCVEQVNADLATDSLLAGSQVSRFLILHKELDADDGELTRTNKVRRGFIADKYLPLIDALYGGASEQFIETVVKFEDGRTGSVSATLKIMDCKTFAPVAKVAA